ncbi:MAG: hypothetical protein LUQ26_05350 [Methylococcaceae bacterium]|nr:hypothetical protein [Methylococcaceae bacterium]
MLDKVDAALEQLWDAFGDTPIDDNECIEQQFLHFPEGTNRFDVWHWFDDCHSIGIHSIQFGTPR